MKAVGLLLATSLAWLPPLTYGLGCEYDMQCKGERVCENGECVSARETEQPAKAPPAKKSPPAPVPGARYCCTRGGKLPLYRAPLPINQGDACQGYSGHGKPLPGTACN